jgi:hypothetical protein
MCVALVSLLTAGGASADELMDAKALRRAGIIETGIGLGLDVAGAGLLLGGFFTPSCAFPLGAPEEGACAYGGTMGNESMVTGLFWSGLAFSVVGDALWIAGVTQWSIGARRVRRIQRATAAR